jgi:predicted negative regulator of RcsB-dependent stress response
MTPPRHPTSRRRQEEKKEAEDVFVEKILESSKWAKANSQVLVIAGIALAILVAAGIYYRNWKATETQRAVAQLEQVQQSVQFGDQGSARAALDQYIQDFSDTPYALEARLLLGQLLLRDAKPDSAVDALAPAAREMDSQPIGIQAGFLMAGAYEEAGKMEDAERMYLRVANTAELEFQIREAMSGAARIRADRGDYSGAAELYEEVLAGMETTDPDRAHWEMKLAEMQAHG